MSETRSRPRRHPYQRPQRATRASGRRRQQSTVTTQPQAADSDSMEAGLDQSGCIDLTGNDSLDVAEGADVIDLTETSANLSVVDADPVVMGISGVIPGSFLGVSAIEEVESAPGTAVASSQVISPSDVDNADTFRREIPIGRGRHGMFVLDDDDDDDDNLLGAREEPSSSGSNRPRLGRRRGRNVSTIDVDELSDEELPELPFTVPDSSTTNGVPSPVKVTCPVCLETDSQIRRNRKLFSTVCGHIFCSTCIKQAIDSQHMCPTCRKRLTKKQIHQIYL